MTDAEREDTTDPSRVGNGKTRSVWFEAPRTVAVKTAEIPTPGTNEVLVEAIVSAVSAGTEGVIYRGEAPNSPRPDPIETIPDDLTFPVRYGYATVGRVTDVGDGVPGRWEDRLVCVYGPHASHLVADPDDLVPVPPSRTPREAVFLPNTESAVNFLLDGRPVIGERVLVLGLGVLGLLTTGLLANTPAHAVVGVDYHDRRRRAAERLGAHTTFHPDPDDDQELLDRFVDAAGGRADLVYELTGNPEAFEQAVRAVGFDGRIVVGSWYGSRPTALGFGDHFHRNRIDITSSQVSTLAPRDTGRWTIARRRATALEWIDRLDVDSLITHEVPVERAPEMYRLLDEEPARAIQVLFRYD